MQGPDRFGWEVVAALARAPALRGLPAGAVALRRYAGPDASLLDDLRGAELAIVVDAMVCDQPPGRLLRLEDLDELAGLRALSSHDLGLAELLLLGRTLGELPPRLIVHG
ncbi:MAG: hydrogenase maturation protease, partial [Chromatiales bacterium]